MAQLASVKSRIESAGSSWATATFASASEFNPARGSFGFYAGRRSGVFEVPCVIFSCEESEEVEARGAGIYKAALKVIIMTNSDETSPSNANAADLHNSRVDSLITYLQDVEAIKTQLAERGALQVFGIVPSGNSSDIIDRNFVEMLGFDVYCQALQ